MFLPLLLGFLGILQGALNKTMSSTIGLTWMVLVGNAITLAVCICFFLVVKTYPTYFPDFVKIKTLSFKWWYIVPGIFGFIFVAGMPLAFYKVGAVKTTVGLIAAQMVTSVLWDIFVDGINVSFNKGLGIAFAFASVIMITFFK